MLNLEESAFGRDSVLIMVEEEAWHEDGTATWVDGRQTEIWGV